MRYTLLLLLFTSSLVQAQRFTKIIPVNAVGTAASEVLWFDYDNDGDLDFLVTGEVFTYDPYSEGMYTRIYENKGNEAFEVDPSLILPQYGDATLTAFNFNQDDRIDLLITGWRPYSQETNSVSLVINQSNRFEDHGSLEGFTRLTQDGATVSRGDVNNDGEEDIFISGISDYSEDTYTYSAYLYLGDSGKLNRVLPSVFTPVNFGTSKLADLDNDGDLDLILSGANITSPYYENTIYMNNGRGLFSKMPYKMVDMYPASIDVTDFDKDGDLDILMVGQIQPGYHELSALLYKNKMGSFDKINLPISLRAFGISVHWGDYDNDGDSDILLSGDIENNKKLSVFENTGNDKFVEINDAGFEVIEGASAWGDYDNDEDLDIVVSGIVSLNDNFEITSDTYILKNLGQKKNKRPSAPANLNVIQENDTTYLISWDASKDDLTSPVSLTYNLSIKKAFSETYLLYPYADEITGERKLVENGNVFLNRKWRLYNLKAGEYEIKVQAIDNGFEGSEWSDVKTIYVKKGNPDIGYQPELKCFPNPATTDIRVLYEGNGSDEIHLNIFSANGKVVLEAQLLPNERKNEIRLSIATLSPGMYYGKVYSNHGSPEVFKFVKR
jgi:hypothetical protein